MPVALNIVGAFSGFLATRGMAQQGTAEALELAGVQFLMLLLGPPVRSLSVGGIQRFRHFAEVLLDVETIDDFYGSGKQFLGQVPDPWSAIAQHHPT